MLHILKYPLKVRIRVPILFVLLFICSFGLNSQVLNYSNGIHTFFDRGKEKGLGDELIFSIKSGYQFPNNETELSGLPGGLLLTGTIESSVNNSLYIGTGFDYWYGKLDNFKLSESETVKIEYSYTEFNIFLKNRSTYKKFRFFLGLGIGTNSLNVNSIYGTEKKGSFTITPNIGAEILLSRGFGLSLELNYKMMNQSNNSNNVFSFRLGPVLILN